MSSRSGPRVKICGITSAGDARRAVELGADLLGLNFYPGSPRALDLERASEIRRQVGDRVPLVGVFVDAPRAEVARLAERVPLDLLQFHGSEPWSELEPFAERAIKVLRVTPQHASVCEPLLEPFAGVWGFLFDTPHPQLYGGTGAAWDYAAIGALARGDRRVLVAGGIGPDNVAAIGAQLPGVWGLDVCSRVESAPGRKDPLLLERLFERLRGRPGEPGERHGKSSHAS